MPLGRISLFGRRSVSAGVRLALTSAVLATLTSGWPAAAQPPADAPTAVAPAAAKMASADGERSATPTDEEVAAARQAAARESALQASLRFIIRRAAVAAIIIAVLLGIYFASRGWVLPIRDIPGLIAFDEAVARATEMGRPTLFTTGGACDLKRVQLFASMPVLRRVAEMSGELDNRLIVPCCYAETMSVHINAIKDGYAQVGAIDQFHADNVRFFPGGQFFFAMASMGWMLQERPAACFYFGYWEADSLLFAETGQTVNAMQIAGTDQLYQIPFFIASCDYTIIGEEFWASSAKLSGDPHLLGSLGAQDLFKIGMLGLIVFGALLCNVPQINRAVDLLRETMK